MVQGETSFKDFKKEFLALVAILFGRPEPFVQFSLRILWEIFDRGPVIQNLGVVV